MGLRGIIEVETDRGGRHALAQEPRPGGEVGKIKQGVGPLQADLLGEDGSVRCSGPARDDRSDVAENRGAQIVGDLVEVLVRDRQRQGIFARFG